MKWEFGMRLLILALLTFHLSSLPPMSVSPGYFSGPAYNKHQQSQDSLIQIAGTRKLAAGLCPHPAPGLSSRRCLGPGGELRPRPGPRSNTGSQCKKEGPFQWPKKRENLKNQTELTTNMEKDVISEWHIFIKLLGRKERFYGYAFKELKLFT